MPRLRRFVLAPLVLLFATTLARAFAPAAPTALDGLVRFVPDVVPLNDPAEQGRLQATLPGQDALEVESGGPWEVDFDLATRRVRRALGTGIPMIPGTANAIPRQALPPTLSELEGLARGFISRHMELFAIDPAEWEMVPEASQPIADGTVQPIALRRVVGGVRVEPALIQLVINHGNLTYVSAVGMEDLATSPVPSLDPADTWAVVAREAAGIGVSLADKLDVDRPELVLKATQAAPGLAVVHRLVRYHTFRLPGANETWRAGVDAHTGELLEFEDANRYLCSLDPTKLQGQVRGGVRPAQATDPEVSVNFIYPLIDNNGPVNGDSNGYYFYGGGPSACSLQGQFFSTHCNGCNPDPALVTSTTDGILDFGLGGMDRTSNGKSTPADRTSNYHLNYARAIARKWMNRTWIDSNVNDNVNVSGTCNAFWDTMAVNFFPSGGGCTNTGEIRDVMQHEWGHGLDQNDGLPSQDRAMGEAYGDYIALFVDHDSCIGQSFCPSGNPVASTGPYCATIPACTLPLPTCTGVRNTDEKRSTRGVLDATNVLTKCGGGGGCPGVLGRECHCEGEIFGQTAFHLAMNLLTGNDYNTGAALPGANPALSDTAAWFTHEFLFFGGAQLMLSYANSVQQSKGIGAYDAFTTVDDDDGNLANGVPHAAYINGAFTHHLIAEPTLRTDTANCTPPADPVFTLTPLLDPTSGNAQVRISWPDQNAQFYVVYRNLKPSDAWLPIRTQILDNGGPYDVYDEPIQVGMTYYYTVIAVNKVGTKPPCPSPGASVKSIVVALPDISATIGQSTDPAPGGDNDGIPEPGERIKVRVDLREIIGLVGLTNASVMLSTPDPLATVTQPGPISYATIAPGATVTGPSMFEVGVSASHGCGTFVTLVAAISADNGCMLRALSLDIPTAGCTVSRGEAAPVGFALTSDNLNGSCTDSDGELDNGEKGSFDVMIHNAGNAPATNVTVNLVSQNPRLSVVGTNPVNIASIAAQATVPATFQLSVGGATCMEPATLVATVNSTENVFPIAKSTVLTLEEDKQAIDLSADFETGFGRWVPVAFTSDMRRVNGGTRACFAGPSAGSTPTCPTTGAAGANGCAHLTSPVFVPGPTNAFSFANWYQLEAFAGSPAQFWDRANVHVIDAGVHIPIAPVSGKMYDGAQGDATTLCHINPEDGWAGCGGNTWGTSTFDLTPWAGKDIQLEINYASDGGDISEGIYIDDIAVPGAQTRICDALTCTVVPSVDVSACTGVDLCVSSGGSDGVYDPGDEITYSLTLSNTGQASADDVQGTVVVTGGTIVSGGTIGGGTPPVNIAPGGNYVHTVKVQVTGSCASILNLDVNNLRAGATPFTPNQAICDRSIGVSVSAGTQVYKDTAGVKVPESPAPPLGRKVTDAIAVPVTRATLAITVTHARPSELSTLLIGPKGSAMVADAAINGTLDVTGVVNADGAGDYSLSIVDTRPGRTGTLDEWSLTLDVPTSSQCTTCSGGGSCSAPGITILAHDSTPCAGLPVVFKATFLPAGSGAFTYDWDFGDGSPALTVTDPFADVFHAFAATPGNYTVKLTATGSQPSCNASGSLPITVQAGSVPSGTIGNRLRAYRSAQSVELAWTGAGVIPPNYKIHKTLDKVELADTANGIGDEAVLARTNLETSSDPFALLVQVPIEFYRVFPETSCGVTVLTP